MKTSNKSNILSVEVAGPEAAGMPAERLVDKERVVWADVVDIEVEVRFEKRDQCFQQCQFITSVGVTGICWRIRG